MKTSDLTDKLSSHLSGFSSVAIAVSGGVDSMTLACVAHEATAIVVYHAVSPAVPLEATDRVRRYSATRGWKLEIIDAGEFEDRAYVANPANRCYFCKNNLYGTIVSAADVQVLSGTNTDDLGDYRPGLKAAAEYGVRHPFVECGIDKAEIRAIATQLCLTDLAELPSAPCLSSRIETGLPIQAPILAVVHRVEKLVRDRLHPSTVRCRVRAKEIVVEMDNQTFQNINDEERLSLGSTVGDYFDAVGVNRPVRFSAYRQGSAFIRVTQ
ncbi:MAG: adenine nucleotide alpha hydrolase [Pseudomonadota bacterium]|nr:adenine nucleotide alpha hydrolase [Pseudomonadota bacterium]